jgi:hypothetical protein
MARHATGPDCEPGARATPAGACHMLRVHRHSCGQGQAGSAGCCRGQKGVGHVTGARARRGNSRFQAPRPEFWGDSLACCCSRPLCVPVTWLQQLSTASARGLENLGMGHGCAHRSATHKGGACGGACVTLNCCALKGGGPCTCYVGSANQNLACVDNKAPGFWHIMCFQHVFEGGACGRTATACMGACHSTARASARCPRSRQSY